MKKLALGLLLATIGMVCAGVIGIKVGYDAGVTATLDAHHWHDHEPMHE